MGTFILGTFFFVSFSMNDLLLCANRFKYDPITLRAVLFPRSTPMQPIVNPARKSGATSSNRPRKKRKVDNTGGAVNADADYDRPDAYDTDATGVDSLNGLGGEDEEQGGVDVPNSRSQVSGVLLITRKERFVFSPTSPPSSSSRADSELRYDVSMVVDGVIGAITGDGHGSGADVWLQKGVVRATPSSAGLGNMEESSVPIVSGLAISTTTATAPKGPEAVLSGKHDHDPVADNAPSISDSNPVSDPSSMLQTTNRLGMGINSPTMTEGRLARVSAGIQLRVLRRGVGEAQVEFGEDGLKIIGCTNGEGERSDDLYLEVSRWKRWEEGGFNMQC